MNALLLIFVYLAVGKWLSIYFSSPTVFVRSLNTIVIQVALPCLIIDKIHAQVFSINALFPLLTPILVFIITSICILLLATIFKFSKATIGCLILLCGTSNTSFVGIPVLKALLGEESIGVGLWVDQSNLIILFTAGLIVANYCAGVENSIKILFNNLIRYRPIQALLLAIALKPFVLPDLAQLVLTNFGNLLTPITMIAVGASLKISREKNIYALITTGLIIKLMVAPLFVFLIGSYFFTLSPSIFEISVLQAAMAPMVTSTIIASEKNLRPDLAHLLTGIGIPVSFISVACWHFFVF